MKIYQSGSFAQKVKKFKQSEKKELDRVIKTIIDNPAVGTEKKGDLKGILIHKFKLQNQNYLIAYRAVKKEALELIMIGPHENYYRDLKNYLKR